MRGDFLKLGFFTDTYLPNRDGVVRVILNTKEVIERKGHRVYTFAPYGNEKTNVDEDNDVFYYHSASFFPYPDYRVALFPFFAYKRAQKVGVEIVHSHGVATMGIAALKTARMLRVGSVATFHTLLPNAARYIGGSWFLEGITKRAIWRYLEWYYSQFERVISPTNYTKKILQKHGIEAVVLPSGVDTARFTPNKKLGERIKKKWGICGKKVALYLGRIAREKRLEIFFEAASKINKESEIFFVVAGKGPALDYYRAMAERMNISGKVIFTGFVPEDQLSAYYNAADVFIMPSSFETQGLSALEALACGVPICVERDSATAEFVKNGKNGGLFSDAEECAESILKISTQKIKMKEFARKTALEYSNEKMVGKLLELYKQLI
ncbi:MAG: glycosyltransferase [Candidatus Anstonellales archaeon]